MSIYSWPISEYSIDTLWLFNIYTFNFSYNLMIKYDKHDDFYLYIAILTIKNDDWHWLTIATLNHQRISNWFVGPPGGATSPSHVSPLAPSTPVASAWLHLCLQRQTLGDVEAWWQNISILGSMERNAGNLPKSEISRLRKSGHELCVMFHLLFLRGMT